jgi:hypothetical protein
VEEGGGGGESVWSLSDITYLARGLHAFEETGATDEPRAEEERGLADLPKLIELMAPTVAGIAECVVELEGAGRRMRIQMKGIGVAELVGLSRMVWWTGLNFTFQTDGPAKGRCFAQKTGQSSQS